MADAVLEAMLRGAALVKEAGLGSAITSGAKKLFSPGSVREFTSGIASGRRLGIGSEEAAKAAPSLWRSVGHNVADQAVGGAIGGTVLGAGLGAYQAQPGNRFSGAVAGAGSGAKAGLIGGAIAGGAGGAMRHGRHKALLSMGKTPDEAIAVMSKSPLENARDAWKNRQTPGAWQADAVEAAAVPATVLAESTFGGVGEKRADAVAEIVRRVSSRASDDPVHDAFVRAKIASIVVVPMLDRTVKTPEQLEAEKLERDRYADEKIVSKALGPLAGTIAAEGALRATVDPANIPALHPGSIARKFLLPGLGTALGAYGAHRMLQSRREAREASSRTP